MIVLYTCATTMAHAWPLIIVYECFMIIVHACTMSTVRSWVSRVCYSLATDSFLHLRENWRIQDFLASKGVHFLNKDGTHDFRELIKYL